MSAESIGGRSDTDRGWHTRLCCKLSREITSKELKDLLHVVKMYGKVPKNAIAKSEDFFVLWGVLERQNLVKVGEYGFLRESFEMLAWMDLADIIKVYSKKIEDFRQTQSQKMAAALTASSVDIADEGEEDDDPLLESFVVVCRPAE